VNKRKPVEGEGEQSREFPRKKEGAREKMELIGVTRYLEVHKEDTHAAQEGGGWQGRSGELRRGATKKNKREKNLYEGKPKTEY